MTVLEKALIEHNMSAISNIYMNISFEQLGRFLGITPEKAETIISKMIGENRIKAILDQKNKLVEFESSDGSSGLQNFNNEVNNTCQNLDSLINDILKVHPDLQKFDTHIF